MPFLALGEARARTSRCYDEKSSLSRSAVVSFLSNFFASLLLSVRYLWSRCCWRYALCDLYTAVCSCVSRRVALPSIACRSDAEFIDLCTSRYFARHDPFVLVTGRLHICEQCLCGSSPVICSLCAAAVAERLGGSPSRCPKGHSASSTTPTHHCIDLQHT